MPSPARTPALTHPTLDWIRSSLAMPQASFTITRLRGSTSTSLFRIQVQGLRQAWVLRLFDNQDWLAEEPDLASHESAALNMAARSGIPVPRLVAADLDGALIGCPAILMTSLPGSVLLTPLDRPDWLRQIAETLLPLHSLPTEPFSWHFYPYNDACKMQIPAWSSQPDLWKAALEVVQGGPPAFEPCFIHRDFHPVNLLFDDGHLSGVVDWPNACLGPAEFDVAWCRVNLAFMFGLPVADEFLERYLSLAGSPRTYHPFWDLLVGIEWLPGPPEFYPPWQQFGLPYVDTPELIQRGENLLRSALLKL